jgi:hypothetical protein
MAHAIVAISCVLYRHHPVCQEALEVSGSAALPNPSSRRSGRKEIASPWAIVTLHFLQHPVDMPWFSEIAGERCLARTEQRCIILQPKQFVLLLRILQHADMPHNPQAPLAAVHPQPSGHNVIVTVKSSLKL